MSPQSCAALAAVLAVAGAMAGDAVSIAFPAEGGRYPEITEIYCIGAVATNDTDTLKVNGEDVEVHPSGGFLEMVPVTSGTNTIKAVWGTNVCERTFFIEFPPKPPDPGEAAKPKPAKPPRDVRKDLGIPADEVFTPGPPEGKALGEITVMIDAGHGGKDAGAKMPHGGGEKVVNLLQALAIRDEFVSHGVKVVMTRDDDSFPELYDRPRRAYNEKVDAFISVHHNSTAANRNPRTVRHTVSYASDENGLELAKAIQKYVAVAMAPVRDAGAQIKDLAVCRNPAVPSCLLEIDFINLPEGEDAALHDTARREAVARAVFTGFLDWLYKGKDVDK